MLDKVFQDILQQLEDEEGHFFITGKAGTGKSTLLQLFRKTTRKKVVVLSPTGISALHVQGQTIHSFFQLPPKLLHPGELILQKRLVRMLSVIEAIIVDEVSMVRADVLDAMDMSLRLHRNSQQPFGGVQMFFFGDLFQLPPVVSSPEEREYFQSTYASPYFFDAHVLQKGMTLRMIELTHVYRQRERHFVRLLDAIRTMQFEYEDLEELNERYHPEAIIEEPYLTLCSTNAATQTINKERLEKLNTPVYRYSGEVKGDFNPKLFPTDYTLELKAGAQVMLIRNDPERRFVNGSLAVIETLGDERIRVSLTTEDFKREVIEIPKMTWEVNKYALSADPGQPIKSEVIGTFTQYPLRLAWAVTIHKSQGKTYDRILIDLGKGAFEFGQTYVALSRCRTLDGVFLKRKLLPRDIMVDERVVSFYDMMR